MPVLRGRHSCASSPAGLRRRRRSITARQRLAWRPHSAGPDAVGVFDPGRGRPAGTAGPL